MHARRPVPAHLQGRAFSVAEAREAGLTPRVLQGSRFQRVLRGVHAEADLDLTRDVMCEAGFAALGPDAIASHGSAGHLLGLPVPTTTRPSFWLPESQKGRRMEGIDVHWYKDRPATTHVGGRPVTTPGRTFVDLAVRLCLLDLVAVGDSAVRQGLFSLAWLVVRCREPRRRWIRRARWAASLIRDGVDSRPETLLRLLLVFADLPEPDVNRPVLDADGTWIATPDLSYPMWKIAIEYDGALHLDRRRHAYDLLRIERLVDEGWIVIVVVADHLFRRPEKVVQRVHHALLRRSVPGTPRWPHDNWRRHLFATQS